MVTRSWIYRWNGKLRSFEKDTTGDIPISAKELEGMSTINQLVAQRSGLKRLRLIYFILVFAIVILAGFISSGLLISRGVTKLGTGLLASTVLLCICGIGYQTTRLPLTDEVNKWLDINTELLAVMATSYNLKIMAVFSSGSIYLLRSR